jgi:hypothetical protein
MHQSAAIGQQRGQVERDVQLGKERAEDQLDG